MALQLRLLAQAAIRRGVSGTVLRPQPAITGKHLLTVVVELDFNSIKQRD